MAFTGAATAFAAPSSANGSAPVRLVPFAVTGSLLDHEAAAWHPTTLLSAEEIALRGFSTPVEWLATLPEASRVPITESQASGADARGDIGTVSLRGLGTGNTLVLLDGRRLAPHPISMPEGTSGVPSLGANVNVLPAAALERIDVLRDGASALYGTDATAGVINVISRRERVAPHASLRFLVTQHGGANEVGATLADGVRSRGGQGPSTLVFSYGYFRRDALRNGQRDFSRTADFRRLAPAPWNGTTSSLTADLRSDRGFFGRFQRGRVNADGTVSGSRPAGAAAAQMSANGTFYFVPNSSGAGSRAFQAAVPDRAADSPQAAHYLNVNEFRSLIPSTTRHTLSLAFEHAPAEAIAVFADALYYRADSRNQREPSRIDATADRNIVVAIDNPYNPFGSRFYSPTGAPNPDGTSRIAGQPSEVILSRVTLPEFGARKINVRSENARLVAGLRGAIGAEWKWESALLGGFARTTDREANAIKESELRDALARTTAASALNPFMTTFAVVNGALTTSGAPFTNPEAMVAPLRGTFFREGKTSLATWDLRVQGRLPGLPAGPMAVAAGGEVRHETYQDHRDAESGRLAADDVQRLGLRPTLVGDNNYLQVSPSDDTDARRTIEAAFLELDAPLRRAPRAAVLSTVNVSVSARFEHSGDYASTLRPKFGLSARLSSATRLRASLSESYRAPNLATAFGGAVQRSITGIDDAYRSAVSQSPDDGASARRISLRPGNRDLKPERARTYSVGLVIEPRALPGVTVSADAWRIEQSDAFARLDAADVIAQDSALLLAANAAAQAKQIADVDLSAAGSPHVLRNPVTAEDRAAFTAYNSGRARADQRAPVGTIRAIGESYLNAARRSLAGVDFSVAYRRGAGPLGSFRAMAEASWLRRFDERITAAAPPTDLSWRDGNTRWKGALSLDWRRGAWGTAVFQTYTGRTQDSFFRTATYRGPGVSDAGFLIVPDSWLTNVSVTRRFDGPGWLQGMSVRLGVNNVFDAAPPFGLGASSDSDGYLRGFGDPRGRAFSVELSKGF